MPVVIGVDAGWGGMGIALCTAARPVQVWPAELGRRSWRMAALVELLEEVEAAVCDLQAHAGPNDPPPRVVIEHAPPVYAGRGNQAATGWGMGELAGAIELWGCRRGWAYPWLPSTSAWRSWWWSTLPKGRAAIKRLAYDTAAVQWGHHLQGLPTDKTITESKRRKVLPYEGLGVDVAEAMLLGVGAARRIASPLIPPDEVPAGPASWRR